MQRVRVAFKSCACRCFFVFVNLRGGAGFVALVYIHEAFVRMYVIIIYFVNVLRYVSCVFAGCSSSFIVLHRLFCLFRLFIFVHARILSDP